MDDTDENQAVEIEIDPEETSLLDLLNIAEESHDKTVSIKGQLDDGTVQWSVVITCGEIAGDMTDNLQAAVRDTVAQWRKSRAN